MNRFLRAIILTPVVLFCLSVASFGESEVDSTQSWKTVANEISMNLEKVLSAYKDGQPDKAKSYIIDAYFGVFEEKKMEHAIKKNVSAKRAFEIESMFGDIRKAINSKAQVTEVESRIKELIDALDNEAQKLDEMGIM